MNGTPDTYRTIHSVIAENAARIPDKIYVHCIEQDKSITYGELYALSNRMAHFLSDRGLGANDRVLVLAENSVEFMATFLGVLRYGATIATANVEMNRAHLGEIVHAVAPALVLYQEGLGIEKLRTDGAPGDWMGFGDWAKGGGSTGFFAALEPCSEADDIAPVCGPQDIGVIFYTSGTESKPKGVLETHSGVWHNFDATADCIRLGEDDRMLDCRSYTWLSAQNMSLGGPLTRGATVYMAKRFSQSRYFDWIRKFEINIGIAVPTVINMLMNRPLDFDGGNTPHLRFMMTSSAPLSPEQWERFEETYGIRLCQSYGCSEGGLMCSHRGTDRKIGSVGLPLKYQQIRITDADGAPLAVGETGRIVVSGTQKSYGYLHHDGRIEKLPDHHHTGDLGYFDADGHVHITGRIRDVIIRGGVKISPLEIDDVLATHPDIAEAATVGVPDNIYGEEVVSYVVCRPGASPSAESVIAHCGAALAEFKTPKQVFFRDTLPRNSRGKLDRAALAEVWKRENAA